MIECRRSPKSWYSDRWMSSWLLAAAATLQRSRKRRRRPSRLCSPNLDPVQSGLVGSLNKPGGNATGMSFFGAMLEPKKLELMHELTAKSAAVAILVNPSNPNTESIVKTVNEAGHALGRNLIVVTA